MLMHFLMYLVPILLGTMGALWLGARFGRPWSPQDEQKQNFEHVTSLVRMLFAFTLAFVVVLVWQEYQAGQKTATAEASALTEVNWAALELPADQRDGLRQRMIVYTHKVIAQEWPAMQDKLTMDTDTRNAWDDLRRYAVQLPTVDARTTDFQHRVLTQLETAGQARRERGNETQSGLPSVFWAGLLVGAAMMLALPALWGTRFTTRSVLFLTVLATCVTGMLFLVGEMDHAFSGEISVPPTAFQELLDRLDRLS
ncbi:hypothetical protein [Kitasatospora sp. LaBMicrA B282]|uniref:bestrophin-like domain n=1 Tax=Kitasatospora sp. LaBMicrA B282 TaxID=3420949 RepID=UPI003D108A51